MKSITVTQVIAEDINYTMLWKEFPSEEEITLRFFREFPIVWITEELERDLPEVEITGYGRFTHGCVTVQVMLKEIL